MLGDISDAGGMTIDLSEGRLGLSMDLALGL